jgi:hypothetical protein
VSEWRTPPKGLEKGREGGRGPLHWDGGRAGSGCGCSMIDWTAAQRECDVDLLMVQLSAVRVKLLAQWQEHDAAVAALRLYGR